LLCNLLYKLRQIHFITISIKRKTHNCAKYAKFACMGATCSLLDSEKQPRKKGQQQRRKKSAASGSAVANSSVVSPARNRSFLKRDFNLEKSGRREPSANVTSGVEQILNPLDVNSVRVAEPADTASTSNRDHSELQQETDGLHLIEVRPGGSAPPEVGDTNTIPAEMITTTPAVQQQPQSAQLFMPSDFIHLGQMSNPPGAITADDPPSQPIAPSVATHRFSVSQNSTATRQTTQRHSVSTVMDEGLHLSDSTPAHYHHRSSSSNAVVATAAPPPPSMLTSVAIPRVFATTQLDFPRGKGEGIVSDRSGDGPDPPHGTDMFTASVSAFDVGRSTQELSSNSIGAQIEQRNGAVQEDSPHRSSTNDMLSTEGLGRPLAVSPLKPLSVTNGELGGLGSIMMEELPSFANETVATPKVLRLPIAANLQVKDPTSRRDGSTPTHDKNNRNKVRPLSKEKRTSSNLFSMADRTENRSNVGIGTTTQAQINSKAVLLKPTFEPSRLPVDASRSALMAALLSPKVEEAISNWIDMIDQGKRMPLADPQHSHKIAFGKGDAKVDPKN
jgi:hypothetical protein